MACIKGRSIPCALQNAISSSRDCIVHSGCLQVAITLMSGARALIESSNLNWSLPFPVAPWQIATAPSFLATSTSFFAIKGLAKMYQVNIYSHKQHLL